MNTERKHRFLSTTGPCDPDDHYMIPLQDWLVSAQLYRYFSDKHDRETVKVKEY